MNNTCDRFKWCNPQGQEYTLYVDFHGNVVDAIDIEGISVYKELYPVLGYAWGLYVDGMLCGG